MTELGIVTEVKPLQPEKAEFPIVVTESPIVNKDKEVQSENAPSAMIFVL